MTEDATALLTQAENDLEGKGTGIPAQPWSPSPTDVPSSAPARPDGLPSPSVHAALAFAHGGGRTFLARQSVPYPFHVTKPHYLDAARPGLATLYLQSASGGLYRGDRLGLALTARPGATAHVTSQAATVVHRTSGGRIVLDTELHVLPDAVLVLTTDPYVLFPDTRLSLTSEIVMHPCASALVVEGLASHDPGGRAEPFRHVDTACRVRNAAGRVLLHERSHLAGLDFAGPRSPLGPYRAWGSAYVLGAAADGLDPVLLDASLDELGVLAGTSRLPNGAGWSVRLLAPGGGELRRGLERVFTFAFTKLVGVAPARRRK